MNYDISAGNGAAKIFNILLPTKLTWFTHVLLKQLKTYFNETQNTFLPMLITNAWKMSKYEVFSGPYLDTLHTVYWIYIL